ncbi:hypothetical protein ACFIOY_00265 [Bradyrhizobium sp. TZ2]
MSPYRNRPWSLSIDKISLVRYDPSPVNVIANCDRLVEAFEAGRFPGAVLKSGRRHRIQLAIPILEDGSLPGRLLIQAGPRFAGLCDYRFEFNPAILGISGVNRVLEILDSILVEHSHHLLRNSFVTRIDLALDLHGLSVDQVIVRSTRQRTHGIFSDQFGIPKTIYLGKPKSNQTAVYNKDSDSPVMRVERRVHPKCRGSDLRLLLDPFRVVQMVLTDSLSPFLKGMIPDQFFDGVRVRGFTHVLATLPAAQRRAIKAVVKDPAQSPLPSTEEVWRSWPQLLRTSGFGFLITDLVEEVRLVPQQAMIADEKADDEL